MLANIKAEFRKEAEAFRKERRAYLLRQVRIGLPLFVFVTVFLLVGPAAAQDPTPVALDIDPTTMTNGLFSGANIIIAALGAVMFMLAGFKLGGSLLRGIVSSVSNVKI